MTVQLIDPRTVRQTSLGREVEQTDSRGRTFDGTRGTVIAVYPVGHPKNPSQKLLVDVRPQADLPLLHRVPCAFAHAHQETEIEEARTVRRQPYAPKARNRVQGMAADIRPGTFVWVQFLGGDLREPVVVATLGFSGQDQAGGPQRVDRLTPDGALETLVVAPLESTMTQDDQGRWSTTYPRQVWVYNGVRFEIDNRGNLHIQASTDHEPVFPGHNGIPGSDTPQGNLLFSARGGKQGDIGFVTGELPGLDREPRPGPGRHFRRALSAKEGTITDETRDCEDGRITRRTRDSKDGSIRDETRSKIGNLVQRLRSEVGRYYLSTRGSDNGRIYLENQNRSYAALVNDRAELHGAQDVVLDAGEVKLGSPSPAYHAVLWETLMDLLEEFVSAFDAHTHPVTDVQSGDDTVETSAPDKPPLLVPFTPLFQALKDTTKSEVVTLDAENASNPSHQDDPGGGD